MKKFIKNLRNRPEEHRRHILHVTTLVAAGLMFSLWVFSLGRTLTDADVQKKVAEDAKPLSALRANLIDGFNSISTENIETFPSSDFQTDMLQ